MKHVSTNRSTIATNNTHIIADSLAVEDYEKRIVFASMMRRNERKVEKDDCLVTHELHVTMRFGSQLDMATNRGGWWIY